MLYYYDAYIHPDIYLDYYNHIHFNQINFFKRMHKFQFLFYVAL